MAKDEEVVLQQEECPGVILGALEVKGTNEGDVFGDGSGCGQGLFHASAAVRNPDFDEGEEDVFLALELRVDSALGPTCEGSDLA
jgi:hypothetical protein